MAPTVAFVVMPAGSTMLVEQRREASDKNMLAIRWDVLIVVGVVILFVGGLAVQLMLRFNAARLIDARRVARGSRTRERNLWDVSVDAHRRRSGQQSRKRRKAL